MKNICLLLDTDDLGKNIGLLQKPGRDHETVSPVWISWGLPLILGAVLNAVLGFYNGKSVTESFPGRGRG